MTCSYVALIIKGCLPLVNFDFFYPLFLGAFPPETHFFEPYLLISHTFFSPSATALSCSKAHAQNVGVA